MIEIFLIISVFLNIVLLACIYLSEPATKYELKNQKLELENQILLKEYYKMKDLFSYLKDNDVKVDWDDDNVVLFYLPKDDGMDELFCKLREDWLND